ncbi:MAG: hypothetical protein RL235_105, partial [Chlamydiota bacterium]
KATLYDSELNLVDLKPETNASPLRPRQEIQQIHLSIGPTGRYKWLTEFQQYPMEAIEEVQEELSRQYQIGALPKDKARTEILLHIDKKAPWEPVARAIFSIRELGFTAHPVYQPMDD